MTFTVHAFQLLSPLIIYVFFNSTLYFLGIACTVKDMKLLNFIDWLVIFLLFAY